MKYLLGYRPYLIHKLNMVCFKAISKEKHTCCICQEECNPAIKCRFCVQGIICSECAISSCEHGINNKCPCCRREKENGQDWKEHLIKSTKICPIGQPKIKIIEIVVTDPDTEKDSCECCDDIDNTIRQICIIYKIATSIIGLLFILWGIGMLTTLMFGNGLVTSGSPLLIVFVPFGIGVTEIILLKCCCCPNFDVQDTFCHNY